MTYAFQPNFIKAGSLRAGFYIACCTVLSLALHPSYAADPIRARPPQLHIGADPRLELLTVVQLLSRYPFLTPYRVDYARDIIARFSPLERHQAVALFRNLSAGAGWSDVYPTAMLYLADPPALEPIQPIPDHIHHAFGGPENFTRFIQALRDFAQRSQFTQFFAGQQKFYRRLEYELREELNPADLTAAIEAYFGAKQISYHLVLSPLLHHGGFGPHLGRQGGPYDVYILLGPTGAERGIPHYGPRNHLLPIVWHELAHAFVNPLSQSHYDELMRYRDLYRPLAEQMERIGYTRWLDCANEHIIRAITARIAHRQLGPEAGRQALREESGRGFRYVHALARRLEEYEGQRDRYPAFAAFFPRLVAVFAQLHATNGD